MKALKKILILCVMVILLSLQISSTTYPSILPLKERAKVVNQWLKIRLETILPEIMRRENLDMWIVICREYNEDPVFLTLVPAPSFSARRTTMLVFFDRGEKGLERLAISRYDISDIYKGAWFPDTIDQWECLAKVITDRDPQRIGINMSDTFAFGDGISSSLKEKLVKIIGKTYASRLHSAERLAVGWLERRLPEELEVYPQIVAIAHTIISEAFSNKVINPGITSTQNVVWWMREQINSLGLHTWFQPGISIQRFNQKKQTKDKNIIKRGDLLHCDIGITYLRLNTDTQEHAYVLRQGERDVPPGLKMGMQLGNLAQDVLIQEFKKGRTGNEILLTSLAKAKLNGLNASIYTHPLGFHGHAAGPTIGLWDQQNGVPGNGDYPLFYDTCYAIELNVKTKIPEWNNQEVRIALEQDAVFTRKGVFYLDGRQTEFHIIK